MLHSAITNPRTAVRLSRSTPFLGAGIAAGIVILLLFMFTLGLKALIATALTLVAIGLLAYPEICLMLFLTAGTFKTEILSLLPAAPDPTAILAVITCLAVVFRILPPAPYLARTAHRLLPGRLLLPYGLLLLVIIGSALSFTTSEYGRAKAFRFAALTTVATFAPFYLLDTETRLRRFLMTAVGLGIAMTLFGVVTGEGLAAFGSTHIATGRVIGLGLLATLFFLFRDARAAPHRWPIWATLAGILLFGFLYAGSRGSLVSLVITGVVLVITSLFLKRGWRTTAPGLVTIALLLAVVATLKPEAIEVMNTRLAHVTSGPLGSSAGARIGLAKTALETFLANPVIGVGIGGFDLIWSRSEMPRGSYPHNIFLELGSELGLVGIGAFGLLLFPTLVHTFRRLRGAPARGLATPLLVCALLIYFLVNALFSGDLNDNRMLFSAIGLCARGNDN
ncbi:MAG: O-antigen ligase family protein [candidate division WOR-3 bacterium]